MTKPGFPLTNKELAASEEYREKDQFFSLVRIERGADGTTHIHIDPDLPAVAKNDAFRDQVNAAAGAQAVISRADVKTRNHALGDNIRTLGVGVFPWVRMQDGAERLILLQRDKGAVAAPLAYMQPAGLVAGDNPFSAMFREATEETCLFSIDDRSKALIVQSFYLPDEWRGVLGRNAQDSIISRKPNNLPNIIKNIEKHHPEYAGYEILFSSAPAPSETAEDYPADSVIFHLPDGQIFKARGMTCDDPVNNSFDFSMALRMDMRHIPKLKNVDPEPFGRAPRLATREEVMALGLVTAPLQRYREIMRPAPRLLTEPGMEPGF